MCVLAIYVCGFVVTLALIVVACRLERSSVEATDTWHYCWLPSLVWPFSLPCFAICIVNLGIKWVLNSAAPSSAAPYDPHAALCGRCSTPLPPKARYCGRCGRRSVVPRSVVGELVTHSQGRNDA